MAEQDKSVPQQGPTSLRPQPVPVQPEPVPVSPEPVPVQPEPVPVQPDEPISLVDFEGPPGESKVSAIGGDSVLMGQKVQFKRELNVTGAGATRCRLFHSRIALAPLEYMEIAINQWLDSEGIEVKQVGHVIGIMEGKSPEPNFIIMVWY